MVPREQISIFHQKTTLFIQENAFENLILPRPQCVLSLSPEQNGLHFDIFKRIFMNEKLYILIQISLKLVLKGPIDNKAMWWLGAEQVTSHYINQCWHSSLTHICGSRGRWVSTEKHESSAAQALCRGNPPVTGGFFSERACDDFCVKQDCHTLLKTSWRSVTSCN